MRSLRLLIVTGFALLVLAGLVRLWSSRARALAPLPVLSQVSPFVLTNQLGAGVERSQLLGHPWVVNLIFTRCPGPCAQLTAVMKRLQETIPAGSDVKLVSLTSDPQYDTPAILRGYGDKAGADPQRWWFLTGPKSEIARLATRELLLVLIEKAPEQRASETDLFLHSTLIGIVDSQGRLRAAVEGLEPGAIEKVIAALQQVEGKPMP